MKTIKALSVLGLMAIASMLSGCTVVGAMIDHALFCECLDNNEQATEETCPPEAPDHEAGFEFREEDGAY